jgi:hypothetical protein
MKTMLTIGLLLLGLFHNAPALANDDEAGIKFIDSIKALDAFDDAVVKDDVLILWPNPTTQQFLNFERIGKVLCGQHQVNGFLVVWLMDSSHYRASKEVKMLESLNCLAGES